MDGETMSRCPSQAGWLDGQGRPSFLSFIDSNSEYIFTHDHVFGSVEREVPVAIIIAGVLASRPRRLNQPTVSLDLDLTTNDPRMGRNHALSLILVAVIQACRNCR